MMLVVVVIVAACSSSRPAIRVAPSASSSTIPQAAFCGLYRRDAPETGHHAHPLLPHDSTAVSFPGRGTGGAWIRRARARVRSRHLGNRHHCFTSSRRHVDHYACVSRRERHDRFDRRLDRWSITAGHCWPRGAPRAGHGVPPQGVLTVIGGGLKGSTQQPGGSTTFELIRPGGPKCDDHT